MSRITRIDIVCPKCDSSFKTPVYTEVDAVIDPDFADMAADGSLFLIRCPQCGFEEPLSVPCLYTDFEKNICIYYMMNPQEEQLALELINERRTRFPTQQPPLTRIVFSLGEFMEKVTIVRAGLDDRVVEYIKKELEERFKMSHADEEDPRCRVESIDDRTIHFAMDVMGEPPYRSSLDISVYEVMQTTLEGRHGYLMGDPPHVSRGWIEMMEEYTRQIEEQKRSEGATWQQQGDHPLNSS